METFVLCDQTSVKPRKPASVRRGARARESFESHSWETWRQSLQTRSYQQKKKPDTVTRLAACTGSRWTWGKRMNNVLHLIISWVPMSEWKRNSGLFDVIFAFLMAKWTTLLSFLRYLKVPKLICQNIQQNSTCLWRQYSEKWWLKGHWYTSTQSVLFRSTGASLCVLLCINGAKVPYMLGTTGLQVGYHVSVTFGRNLICDASFIHLGALPAYTLEVTLVKRQGTPGQVDGSTHRDRRPFTLTFTPI